MALEELEDSTYLSRFTGSDPARWIRDAEWFFSLYEIYEEERFPFVVEFFDDEPFYWFNSWYRGPERLTWKSFTIAMLHQFHATTASNNKIPPLPCHKRPPSPSPSPHPPFHSFCSHGIIAQNTFPTTFIFPTKPTNIKSLAALVLSTPTTPSKHVVKHYKCCLVDMLVRFGCRSEKEKKCKVAPKVSKTMQEILEMKDVIEGGR